MFLQGNLPLEFKEGGTLLGRFWRGIWNWEDCFWLEDKKEKKRGNRRIFLFLETNLGFLGGDIYMWEQMKERGNSFWSSTHWRIFWRKSTEKPKRSDCSQGSSRCVPGYTRDSFSCSISPCVRFWMFSILLIGVDAKRPQIVLLILIAYLFVSNLFMICPTSLSPLKKSWNVALSDFPFIIPVYSLPVSSILHYTCFETFLLVPWWLSINVLYEWKFGEEKDREDPVFHPTEINLEIVFYTN